MAEKHRKTFLSYSRSDKDFAIQLAKELKSEGFDIWLDKLDIPTGARWDDEIEKALRECAIFLVILTPTSIASENVKDEMGYAIDHGKRILPILLKECEIPLRLRRFQYADLTKMNFNDGVSNAKSQLGILANEESIPMGGSQYADLTKMSFNDGVSNAKSLFGRSAIKESIPAFAGTLMDKLRRTIFISYAWGEDTSEREGIVNQLDQFLQKWGLKIIRDKRDLGYKGSIRKFMQRIGEGDGIIVIISDKYLRSKNCMYELVQIAKNKQFVDRIFPIILSDAKIYDAGDRLDYIEHWEKEKARLNKRVRELSDFSNLESIQEELNDVDEFRDEIDGLTSLLKDMNTLNLAMHRELNFIKQFTAIFENSVFISYAWGEETSERDAIVNQIDLSLQKRGLKIIRDKRDLGYKGSIRKFMERIGEGDSIIVVISDKYLRSKNCMYELVQIAKNKQFVDRIFPIILSDAKIYDAGDRLDYIEHWEKEKARLNKRVRELSDFSNLESIQEELNDVDEFRDEIDELSGLLKDMNTLNPAMHRDSDFSELFTAIEKRTRLVLQRKVANGQFE